jgi:hypothetical protein
MLQSVKNQIQRVSEINTLILTSDGSRQGQQNCYVKSVQVAKKHLATDIEKFA